MQAQKKSEAARIVLQKAASLDDNNPLVKFNTAIVGTT